DLFAAALDRGCCNPQIRAVAHLHWAEVLLKQDNLHKAEEHFAAWHQLESQVENAIVHAEAERVQEQIHARMKDFVISQDETNLNLDYHAKRLRDFLFQEA